MASGFNVDQPDPLWEKWGSALRQGFVQFPTVLLRRQAELGIDAVQLVVLLQLIASWWDKDDAPYPSTQTMASRMGLSVRTVQRSLKELEAKGLLRRKPATESNDGASLVTRYDLQPLSARLINIVQDQVRVANEAKHALRQQPIDLA